MEAEVLWYMGACLLSWAIGYVCGMAPTALAKLLESAT
jgi:hypothetical protein